jgi:peptide subunit release factor 1 (eRF1)
MAPGSLRLRWSVLTVCLLFAGAAGKFVFSVKDTMMCLEMGAVETLIVWENLDCDRYELNNPSTSKTELKLLSLEQAGSCRHGLRAAAIPSCAAASPGAIAAWEPPRSR